MTARSCPVCQGSLEGMRPHAVYCSRRCKTKASDARRRDDGRALRRDRQRYPREAEKRRAQAMEYLRAHPEKMRAVRRRRKGQLKAEALRFDERDWRRLVARYDGRCAYCGTRAPLVREHVVPLCRGGRHSVGNILPACRPCNGSKGKRLLSDWRYRVLAERR